MKFLIRILGKGAAFKLLFNISPMYRRTGGRLLEVSDDLKFVKLKLPLMYKTRNYVGTLYGGHMYSCVDGIYMVQLIQILGKEYVVWDKSASIRFRRPGNQTLYAEFNVTTELIQQIKNDIKTDHEKDFNLSVNLVDATGAIYAEVEKKIYIADRHYHRNKKRQMINESQQTI